ncbi:MAG TPA: ABC transporter ATP-binding protein [Acidimicrobiia bacterium]|nr:ABC transporter ATP-binding protein [Acidimicrobiia bacterium]
MSVVETRRLTKRFGDTLAVDHVDLASKEGEFLVLLGPSGCGKTTLLRMIAGLEEPTEGEIYIGGGLMNRLPPRTRKIAMVFQSYALYPHMTVRRNIAFPLRAEGVDKEVQDERVQWAAELLGIERYLERRPRQLSGGERQRVALARALVREPSIFLLDEPLSNLDAKLRASARDDLLEFQRRIGITTIYVTHDQVEAMGMGDRIAVMSQGRIRQFGSPEEIYADPADTFVATFIGSPPMNLLEGPERIVGFRPENFRPADEIPESDLPSLFRFHVNRSEYLGSDRFLYGTVEGDEDQHKVIARVPVGSKVETDATHTFGVAAADLCYFDPVSQLRVGAPR